MKVCFVTHYTHLYGANKSLLSLVDKLQDHSVEPFVLVPSTGPITDKLSSLGVQFYSLPHKRWMSKAPWKAPARLVANVSVLPFAVTKILKWDIDLIYTNSSVIPIGAVLAALLSLPHVWHIREFGQRDFGLHYDWGKSPFQTLVSRADARIAVSEAVRQQVLSDVEPPSYVVYNGVISRERLDQLNPKQKESGGKPFTFAIVGQISPAKGQKQALQALHQLRQESVEARLLVAGDGAAEHLESLDQLCQSLGLDDVVTLLGYVSDPFEVYRQADAVLMCSPHEAMGRVTAEAMAAARPVIGYNSDGTAELINDEQNGLLYDGTTEDLADCMRRLIEEPDWTRSLGENGQKKAKNKFTNEVYANRVCGILSEAIN